MRILAIITFGCFLLSGCALFGPATLDKEMAEQARQGDEISAKVKQLRQHFQAGEGFYENDKLAEAEAQYKAMLALKPEDDSALYRLGTIAFKRGQFAESAAYFERAVKSNPRNQRAQYNLATIRLMQAENHFKYYVALSGKDTDLAKVTELLGSIDRFANADVRGNNTQALDEIAGALKK